MKPIDWNKIVKEALKVIFISIAVGALIAFLFGGSASFSLGRQMRMAITSLGIGIPMWMGNFAIGYFIEKRIGWSKNPSKALKWSMVCTSIFNTAAVFTIVNIVFYLILREKYSFHKYATDIINNTLIISLISFMIWSFYLVKNFLRRMKEQIVWEEKYKRDIATHQYETLKNQVNPHFLFNSLNVLSSLVETNPEAAVKFIRKLADVYRYVLDAKDKELVPLEEEIRLAEAYLFMQKKRFDKNLEVEINGLPSHQSIVPLSLQMLLENAIKHNIVTNEQPLTISISFEKGYLICRNKIQKKPILPDSNTIGLKNIAERYAFLTDAPMEYGEKEGEFIVRLPLIEG